MDQLYRFLPSGMKRRKLLCIVRLAYDGVINILLGFTVQIIGIVTGRMCLFSQQWRLKPTLGPPHSWEEYGSAKLA